MTPTDIREVLRLHGLWLNLSSKGVRADLSDADLREADLRWADLRGAFLRGANLRGAFLREADLRNADLSGADLRGAFLRGADLRDADLSGANLHGADLRDADLYDADLNGADLSGAVLRDVPVIPELHQRIAEAVGKDGARLEMASWHGPCGTTHCRAGWAIHLAGDAGYALEEQVGPAVAGALIYAFSTGDRVPDFYADDEDALFDICECAQSRVVG